ncbi:hypothetical protein GPECTOR_2g1333 [Gonium pectorale]|uniref:Uncharacterized protein n=1 Tax=Gonium pectorale TaxID=33097 RepID=A0A150H199_GONPE|nr:hypothetical protein GPECTOR_2g1333 [Gonium pectorale]|eukprot:KXZ55783.1 hypothetical protein GPECTOR_2g1333 [Gonium pectorale]
MRVSPSQGPQRGASSTDATPAPWTGRHWKLWITLIRYARAFIFLVNVRTLGLASLACMMVYFCESRVLDMRFRMEFSIISVGTVFPLVFSIQQAFQRREEALRQLSILKGQIMGMYFCHRDWDVSDGIRVRSSLGDDGSPQAVRAAQLLMRLLGCLKRWLVGRTAFESEAEWRMLYSTTQLRKQITAKLTDDFFRGEEDDSSSGSGSESDSGGKGGGDGSGKGGRGSLGSGAGSSREGLSAEDIAEQDPHWQLYYELYDIVNQISIHNESLTTLAGCTKPGEAGMARLTVYLTTTVEVIERLRSIREYRTPFMLRYVSFVLVLASVFLTAPYFAFMCHNSQWEDDRSGRCPAGYFTAVIYVLVVSTLFHVQVALENPFDGIGMDDVFVNMDREFAVTVRRFTRSRAAAAKEAAAREEAAALEAQAVAKEAALEGSEAASSAVELLAPSEAGSDSRAASRAASRRGSSSVRQTLSILVDAAGSGSGKQSRGGGAGGRGGGGGGGGGGGWEPAAAEAVLGYGYGDGAGLGAGFPSRVGSESAVLHLNRPGSGSLRHGHGAAGVGHPAPAQPEPSAVRPHPHPGQGHPKSAPPGYSRPEPGAPRQPSPAWGRVSNL